MGRNLINFAESELDTLPERDIVINCGEHLICTQIKEFL